MLQNTWFISNIQEGKHTSKKKKRKKKINQKINILSCLALEVHTRKGTKEMCFFLRS